MERKRAYIVVIVAAAVLLLLFVGLMYNAASLKKQSVSKTNQVTYAAQKLAAKEDLMIYWIGDLPPELSGIANVVTVIAPDQISEDTMPIKYSTFKVTVYNEDGSVAKQVEPRDYKDNMIIILYNVSLFTDEQKDILLNCITENNVPMLAIGESSIAFIREALMYTPGSFEQNDSFYYKLDEGYKDHVLDNKAITAGGEDFALDLMDYLYELFYAYDPEAEASQMELEPQV